MGVKFKDQIAFFVQRNEEKTLALWIEYEVQTATITLAAVIKPVQLLYPRTKLGMGYEEEEYGVSREVASIVIQIGHIVYIMLLMGR